MKNRSGWYSTKLHLSLIGMALVTGLFVASSRSDAAFDTACFTIASLAAVYSTTRVGESAMQRRPLAGATPNPNEVT